MEPWSTLLTQGGLGLMAGTFLWLYIQEKKEHKLTRSEKDVIIKEKEALMELRRVDAVEVRTEVTSVMPVISQNLQNINDKIEIIKGRRN